MTSLLQSHFKNNKDIFYGNFERNKPEISGKILIILVLYEKFLSFPTCLMF